MPDGFLVLLFPLELENQNLVGPTGTLNGRLYRAAGHHFTPPSLNAAFTGNSISAPISPGQLFHADHVAGSHPVLFSAC